MKKNKKGISSTTLAIILGTLALAALIVLFVRANFPDFFKNLPGFQGNQQYQVTCNDAWVDLHGKNYTLIFKGQCSGVDFMGWGACCVEVTSDYDKTKMQKLKWYWSGDESKYCGDFASYDISLLYDAVNKFWNVKTFLPEKNLNLVYSGSLKDCSSPEGYYICASGSNLGGVYVRDDITCEQVKQSMIKTSGLDKIKNAITIPSGVFQWFYIERDNKKIVDYLCKDVTYFSDPLYVRFTGGWFGKSGRVYFTWDGRSNKAVAADATKAKTFYQITDSALDKTDFEKAPGFVGIDDEWENKAIMDILSSKNFDEFVSLLAVLSMHSDVKMTINGKEKAPATEAEIKTELLTPHASGSPREQYLASWINPGYCKSGEYSCSFFGNSGMCGVKDDKICISGKTEECGDTCLCNEDYKEGDKITVDWAVRAMEESSVPMRMGRYEIQQKEAYNIIKTKDGILYMQRAG